MNGNKCSLLIDSKLKKLFLSIICLLLIFVGISCAKKDAEAWFNKSRELYMEGHYEEALEACNKSLELNPNSCAAWTAKGVIFIKLNRYNEALMAVEKAIEIAPNYSPALYNRACYYSLKGDKEPALKDLQEAIKLDSKLKETAKKDDEFKSFWNDEDFKKIVKQ